MRQNVGPNLHLMVPDVKGFQLSGYRSIVRGVKRIEGFEQSTVNGNLKFCLTRPPFQKAMKDQGQPLRCVGYLIIERDRAQ